MPISLILIPHKTEYKNKGKMRKTKKQRPLAYGVRRISQNNGRRCSERSAFSMSCQRSLSLWWDKFIPTYMEEDLIA